MKDNLDALEQVWDYAIENLDYFGTNTPVDQCFSCDFHGEFTPTEHGFRCPKCGEMDVKKMSVVRRTCGYLGCPTQRGFNEGKQKEVINRTKHIKG
jgi:ribonucleoside-triphosphate reductase